MPLVRKRDYTRGRQLSVWVLFFVAAVLFLVSVVEFSAGGADHQNTGLLLIGAGLFFGFMGAKAWVPPGFRRTADDLPEDPDDDDEHGF